MKKALFIGVLFLGLFTSCLSSGSDKLAYALEQAKQNREELFKVLAHYQNDADTLKYKAAIYLIENMPYQYSSLNTEQTKVEAAKTAFLKDGFIHPDSLQSLLTQCRNFTIAEDLKTIKSDYLIRNIDMAFEAWHKRPWGKHYTFQEFCEYLLPYRATNEELEEWRTTFLQQYSYILDSLYTGSDVIEAANAVCKVLKEEGYIHTMTFNPLGTASPLFIAKHRIGDCTDECNFTILVMRALGIPIQKDFYAYSPETFSSHGWCVVLDTTKQNVPLFYSDFFAQRGSMETDPRRKCKVYRRTYALQDEFLSLLNDKSIPDNLKDPHRKDVSDEYFHTELTLPITDTGKNYYLGTFKREQIIPIIKGEIKEHAVTFGTVEDKNIYLLLSGTPEHLTLESAPFIFLHNHVHYLIPDTAKMNKELLYRKYPMPVWNKERLYRVLHARFYAGDTPYRISRKLYEICDTPYVCYNRYPLESKLRYLKYIARDNVPVELAELHFYDNTKEIKPLHMEAGEAYDSRDPAMQLSNCFDHDPLTYYLSKHKGDSIIFDFGREVHLTHAICVPRNDDNFIRIDDEYELFYFDHTKGWIPILKQVATEVTIPCQVPDNALLLLRDRTRGQEEQIFYFQNHRQIYINDIQ